MKTIPLQGAKAAGRVAVVDDEDYELVIRHRWRIHECYFRSKPRANGPYARTVVRVDGRRRALSMHQLITGYARTDHINHDGLDNRRSNLREATSAQNAQNKRPHSGTSSSYRGVYWHKSARKWQASIKVNGRCQYLGLFSDEDAAARAYDVAALAAFGEFAYLNLARNPWLEADGGLTQDAPAVSA